MTPGWPLVALLAWGVLTFGAVYPWAYWPLFAAAGALGLRGTIRDRAWRDVRLRRLAIALSVVAAAISLQTLAVPVAIASAVSPGIDTFFRAYVVNYHPATLQSLSLDPAATLVVLAEFLALALLLVGVARMARRWELEWVVTQIMALAVAVALVGIVQHALIDAANPLIYGFWRPREGRTPFGPFVNRNHFAGWMLMVLPLVAAYGWALVQRAGVSGRSAGGWLRWVGNVEGNRLVMVIVGVVVMAMSIALTGSRSGVVAGLVGLLVVLMFMWRTLRGRARWVVTAAVSAMCVGAALWAGIGPIASRFGVAGEDVHGRFAAWRDTWHIVTAFPITGTGLGGYRSAMLVFQSGDRDAVYAQAHNDYLQLLAEGGLLVTLPALVALGVLVTGIVRRLRSDADDPVTYWLRRGAVAGLVGVGAQSVVEFSLQMPGNAAMCAALMAIALHRPRTTAPHAYRV